MIDIVQSASVLAGFAHSTHHTLGYFSVFHRRLHHTGNSSMLKHDKPVCYLSFPSYKPDVVVKILKADAYRHLADRLMAASQTPINKRTAQNIRKYNMMADMLREAANFDARETKLTFTMRKAG